MNGLILLLLSAAVLFFAYTLYGSFLSRSVFCLDHKKQTPANEFEDGVDYVPSQKGMVFGHHFTSIAGTGPIVGPAIGVIWGWLPALVWVVFGSIFMGAVHDFGVLVISLRNKGRSICDFSDQFISKRVQLLFFVVVCFSLWIVIAIFGLIIAIIFNLFPEAVFPVWFEIPIAIGFGYYIRRFPSRLILYSIVAMLIMTISVIFGHYYPIELQSLFGIPSTGIWTILLLIYAGIASVLPVQTLLQPRDYINAWQLFIAMGLLLFGAVITGLTEPFYIVAPAIVSNPTGAPSMMPFLFITIACGAISGFHSLVASGTSSKQINKESDALMVGYGSMLIEGALAVMVIVACCAGIGLGYPLENGSMLYGLDAWNSHYSSWGASSGLASKLQAVVIGSANLMTSLGISQSLGAVIMGVFIASFAGTTLDTSTRLQRYVITELAFYSGIKISVIKATLIAVLSGGILAFSSGLSGKGALELWPLFGALNQLLAMVGLGLITLYILLKKPKYSMFSGIPFLFMFLITGWAMFQNQLFFLKNDQYFLVAVNSFILMLSLALFVSILIHVINLLKINKLTV